MADIRCPMCGKSNPPDRDTCQFCEARLTPLIISPFDDTPSEEDDLTPFEDGGDIPDWLKDLRPAAAEPAEPAQAESLEESADTSGENFFEAAETEQGVPDWLERIRRRTEEAPEESQPAEPEEEQRPLPDWLGAGALEDSPFKPTFLEVESPAEPEAEQPASEGEDVSLTGEPDWLQRIREKQQSQEEAPAEPPLDVPRFEPAEPAAPAAAEPAEKSPEPPSQEPPKRTKGMTGWLTAFDSERPARTTFRREPGPLDEGEKGAAPGWQAGPGPEPPQPLEEVALPASIEEPEEEVAEVPFEAPDLSALPDWLADIAPEEVPGPATPSEPVETLPSLEETALPSWLEAMRPVEAVIPDNPQPTQLVTDQVEASGPLAGLRGVLPIEQAAVAPRKPRAYSLKLQIPENQQAHIALLEELMATESASRPVAQGASISSQLLLRLAVALVMLVVVLGSLYLGGGLTPPPGHNRQSAEITSTSFAVGTLPQGAPVLLAFDFEPGFSAEMDYAAGLVLNQLVEKDARLAVVSTSPTGPALAEAFLREAGSASEAHANLGFVPGGTLGLVGLVENLAGVFPYDLTGRPVWVEGQLAGLQSPADFSLVIVLTESPTTARAWIEQVQPALKAKQVPLLMLLSAQAEPLVRPYFEGSQQVNGIIAGQAGGAAYTSLLGASQLPGAAAPGDWDALSAGLLVAAIFILAGSLVNAALLTLAPQKRAEGEK